MLGTALSPEHTRLQQTCREFADEVLIPAADLHDREESYPASNVDRLAKLGMMGILAPSQYGGLGMDNLGLCLALEEINRGCASTGVTLSVHNSLLSSPLLHFGTEEQQQQFFPRLASGEALGAYAITEPDHGSDAVGIETTCRREGDEWVLNGTKAWITNGSHASIIITFATIDPSMRSRGINAFVIENTMPGFKVGKKEKKLGIRGSDTVQLIYDEMRVPAQNLLGEEGQGFKIAMHTLDGGRIGIATQGVGIAQACLDATVNFAESHQMFGRKLADNQLASHKIADMATRIEASRLLTIRAALLKDAGLPHSRQASMAKLSASEIANDAARMALEIHGGAGLGREHPVERLFRDAKITEIYEGTSQIQRLVIARHVRPSRG
ncbi:MAG: acyl-CoA dehydrogenase family protein [Planctomycetota bacterium]|nr:acyl-CoA dehydrogenase family protein [Planctomycetota bacterium]